MKIIDEPADALHADDDSPEHRKLLKAVRGFEAYFINNPAFIPNVAPEN